MIAFGVGVENRPSQGALEIFAATMVLSMLVGLIGFILHIDHNLTAQGAFLGERFLNGAPSLAPVLYDDIGLLGLIARLDPREQPE